MEQVAPRRPDWRPRLQAFLLAAKAQPYAPGTHDCALFGAGGVEAMTGTDLAAPFRGYRSIAGGLKRLRKAGYKDHVDMAAQHFEEIAPAFAACGDLAVLPGVDMPALGILQGARVYVLTESGVATALRLEALRAFRV